jgi:hypothetical protein
MVRGLGNETIGSELWELAGIDDLGVACWLSGGRS